MSDDVRCYGCGFRTAKRELFIRYNGNGDRHWFDCACPQCFRLHPHLAEAEIYPGDPPAYFKMPEWSVEETNYGLYVKAGSISCPMIPEHQLWTAPASLLDRAFTGSFADYSRAIKQCGDARAEQFHKRCDEIMMHREIRIKIDGAAEPARIWADKVTEEARKDCKVGDYDERTSYDGWKLEAAARALQGKFVEEGP